jgi:excinuclease UvrABC nuclease subunit
LKHFGSVAKIKNATIDEIAAAPAMNRKLAAEMHRILHGAGQ